MIRFCLAVTFAATALLAVDYKPVTKSSSVRADPACLKQMEYAMAEEYCVQLPPNVSAEGLRALLGKDSLYRDANAMLYDKKHWKETTVRIGDPESPGGTRKVKRKVVDYGRALMRFHESVKKHGNPVSAYEGLQILKSFFALGTKRNMQYRRDFAKTLYRHKTCEGYLEWGDVNARGIMQPVDRKKALEIYTEGYNACRDVGWYGTVLGSRIAKMKLALKRVTGR